MSDSLAQMIPALAIFVGGPLLIWWLKRGRRSIGGGGMRVSARTALTRNSVIAVVELDDKRLLVGATDHGVTLLSELDSTPTAATQPELPPSTDALQDAGLKDEHTVLSEPNGPRTSPLEQLRVMTTRRVTRPRPPRVHH
jgi:flagellar biogenesis protein FliO